MGKVVAKLKATSILETVVAMIIIVVIFGIAASIFIRSGSGAGAMKKLRAEQVLKAYAVQTREQAQLMDADEQIDSFEVRRQVLKVNDSGNLWNVHFSIYDRDEVLLMEWREYILNPN